MPELRPRVPEVISRTANGGPYLLFSGEARTVDGSRKEVGLWPSTTSKLRFSASLWLEAEVFAVDESTGAAVCFLARAHFRRTSGALERVSHTVEIAPGTSDWSVAIEAVGNAVAVVLYGGATPVVWAVHFRALLAQKAG